MSTPAAELPSGKTAAEEMRALITSLMGQQANQQVQTLLTENYQYREERRQLRQEIETLKKSQVPEDAIVLTGEDATAYDEFLALELDATQVTEAITERDTLKTESATLRREQQIAAAAEAEGLVPSKLKQLAGDLDIVIEEVEEADDKGEKHKIQRAFVQTKGENNVVTKTRLTEHAVIKEFLPSLTAEGQSTGAQGATGEKKGTSFVKQGAGGKTATGKDKPNPATNVLSRKYKTPATQGAAQ
jgi:hypothetical protein